MTARAFTYNETEGRDGWMLALGRRVYYVYKQRFPMQYIYGLKPEDNRETCIDLVDVRELPDYDRMVADRAADKPKRLRSQEAYERETHALVFALAFHNDFDFEWHFSRERAEWLHGYQKQQFAASLSHLISKCLDYIGANTTIAPDDERFCTDFLALIAKKGYIAAGEDGRYALTPHGIFTKDIPF